MRTSRAQSWSTCDPDVSAYVDRLCAELTSQLAQDLVGIYLHGSLAMGSYYRPKSDIDVLVVVREPLDVSRRRAVAESVARLAADRPTVGFVELSVITATAARDVPVPMPYEVHYSEEWHDRIVAGVADYEGVRTDLDLLAHVTHLTQRGVALRGRPVAEVFGVPPWSAFLDAVLADARWLLHGDHLVETPYYGVLNICRVLQLLTEDDGRVHSKEEGGEWALSNLPPEHHPVIRLALAAYRSPAMVSVQRSQFGVEEWDEVPLLAFRDYARSRLMA
jgi:streptomycin 3"-adenylyltransferase